MLCGLGRTFFMIVSPWKPRSPVFVKSCYFSSSPTRKNLEKRHCQCICVMQLSKPHNVSLGLLQYFALWSARQPRADTAEGSEQSHKADCAWSQYNSCHPDSRFRICTGCRWPNVSTSRWWYMPSSRKSTKIIWGFSASRQFTTLPLATWAPWWRSDLPVVPCVPRPVHEDWSHQQKGKRFENSSFSRVAPSLWNVLPRELNVLSSVNAFRRQLKTYIFKKHYQFILLLLLDLIYLRYPVRYII